MRGRFLEIFRSKSAPAHVALRLKILGRFPWVADADASFLMSGFPDLPNREPMKPLF
jgi:hypothetical protein